MITKPIAFVLSNPTRPIAYNNLFSTGHLYPLQPVRSSIPTPPSTTGHLYPVYQVTNTCTQGSSIPNPTRPLLPKHQNLLGIDTITGKKFKKIQLFKMFCKLLKDVTNSLTSTLTTFFDSNCGPNWNSLIEAMSSDNSKEDDLIGSSPASLSSNDSWNFQESFKLLEQPGNPTGVESHEQPTNLAGVESQVVLKIQLGSLPTQTYEETFYQSRNHYQSKNPNRCGVVNNQLGFQPTNAVANRRTSNQDTTMYDHDWGGVHGLAIRVEKNVDTLSYQVLPRRLKSWRSPKGPTKIYMSVHINSPIGELMWGWSANSPWWVRLSTRTLSSLSLLGLCHPLKPTRTSTHCFSPSKGRSLLLALAPS